MRFTAIALMCLLVTSAMSQQVVYKTMEDCIEKMGISIFNISYLYRDSQNPMYKQKTANDLRDMQYTCNNALSAPSKLTFALKQQCTENIGQFVTLLVQAQSKNDLMALFLRVLRECL